MTWLILLPAIAYIIAGITLALLAERDSRRGGIPLSHIPSIPPLPTSDSPVYTTDTTSEGTQANQT